MNRKISFPIAIIIILACAGLVGVIAWQYGFIPGIAPPSSGVLSDKELLKYAKSSFNKEEMMGKNIIIGFYNGNPIRVTFPCSDVCPNYTIRIIRYDVDVSECDEAGGFVKAIYVPYAEAMMPEEFCFPKIIVDNNIYEFIEMPEDETADWNIYRNEKYGYEVKYPNDVIIEELDIAAKPVTENSRDIVFIIQNPEYPKTGFASNLKVEIPSLTKQESDLLLSEFVSQVAKDFERKETFTIGSEEAIKLTFKKGSVEISSYSFLAEDIDIIFMKHNQIIFMITLSTIQKDKAVAKTIFNQMLSTFRFLE